MRIFFMFISVQNEANAVMVTKTKTMSTIKLCDITALCEVLLATNKEISPDLGAL